MGRGSESRAAVAVAVVSALIGGGAALASCAIIETEGGLPVETQKSVARTLCAEGEKFYRLRPEASSATAWTIRQGLEALENRGTLDPGVRSVVSAVKPAVEASAQMDAATARVKAEALKQACRRL